MLVMMCVGMHVCKLRLAPSKGQHGETSSLKSATKKHEKRAIWWSYNIRITEKSGSSGPGDEQTAEHILLCMRSRKMEQKLSWGESFGNTVSSSEQTTGDKEKLLRT